MHKISKTWLIESIIIGDRSIFKVICLILLEIIGIMYYEYFYMKKLLFLIALFILCHGVGLSEERRNVYFILPEGHPYRLVGFSSGEMEDVSLKFGDRITVLDNYVYGSFVWYYCSKGQSFFYLPEIFTVKEPEGTRYDEDGNIILGSANVDRLNPIPIFYKPTDLIAVPKNYMARGYETRAAVLRKAALDRFIHLIADAEKDGVNIRIISAFRDARYQSYLYYNALKRFGMFQNSVAKPGHSEHQLGTTCDLTTDEIASGLTRDFENTAAFLWLKDHIPLYGIFLSYPKYKARITGYIYEPWHFRYWGEDRWENLTLRYRLFLRR